MLRGSRIRDACLLVAATLVIVGCGTSQEPSAGETSKRPPSDWTPDKEPSSPEESSGPLPPDQLPSPAVGQGEGEPPALAIEPAVWDQVGSGWSLTQASVQSEWVSDGMGDRSDRTYTTYLLSPGGETFRLFDLSEPTDGEYFTIHWDPTQRLGWFGFFNGDGRTVFEYGLETGTRSAAWGVGAFANNGGDWGAPAGRWEAIYVGTQANGTEVWADGQMGFIRGLVFRDDNGGWRAASVNAYIGSMTTPGVDVHVNTGFTEATWWIREGERGSSPIVHHWLRHNLVADTWTELTVKSPTGYNYCFSRAAVVGNSLEVGCRTSTAIDTYRIDLTGVAAPVLLGSEASSSWTVWMPAWSDWDRYSGPDGGIWEYIVPAP